MQQQRAAADEVHAHHLNRGGGVRVEALLSAEDTDRDHHEVEPA